MTQRQKDEAEIIAMELRGSWVVLRRGSPRLAIRIVRKARELHRAESRFNRIADRMRQGMLALVDPEGQIERYVSEPMVRSRW